MRYPRNLEDDSSASWSSLYQPHRCEDPYDRWGETTHDRRNGRILISQIKKNLWPQKFHRTIKDTYRIIQEVRKGFFFLTSDGEEAGMSQGLDWFRWQWNTFWRRFRGILYFDKSEFLRLKSCMVREKRGRMPIRTHTEKSDIDLPCSFRVFLRIAFHRRTNEILILWPSFSAQRRHKYIPDMGITPFRNITIHPFIRHTPSDTWSFNGIPLIWF